MNRQFRSVRSGEEQSLVLEMMRREAIGQIPVLDAEGRVEQLLLLQDLLVQTQLPNAVLRWPRLREQSFWPRAACWKPPRMTATARP